MARALLVLLLVAGCGSISAADAGAGGRGGTGGAAGELGGRGGNMTTPDAGADAGCMGCVAGGRCIPPSQQTDDVCGADGGACQPTMLACLGTQGPCAQGDQVAVRYVCGSAVAYKVCCPISACVPDQCYRCMQSGLPCP